MVSQHLFPSSPPLLLPSRLCCMQAGGAHAPCEEPVCFTHQRPDFQPRPLHAGLQLAPDAVLDESPRRRCPGCDRSNAYYCCDCLLPMTAGVPAVRLPFNLFVLTHAQQHRSTATGVHLALLAPGQVQLLPVDELPQLDARTTVVLFPDDVALPADCVDPASVTDVVVVDSKWGQARSVVASDKLRGVRHVRLGSYVTSYWRYHTAGVPPEGLCTVEAVFFLCRELHTTASHPDCHCFDNLLWYFAHQHKTTQAASRARATAKHKLAAAHAAV